MMNPSNLWAWKTLGHIFSDNVLQSSARVESISEAGWEFLARFALRQLVAPELHQRLVELNLSHRPPPSVVQGLEGAFELNQMIHSDLRRMFLDICEICNGLGVVPIVLKGSIDALSLSDSVNSSRMVSDLDILVEKEAVRIIFQELLNAGFRKEAVYLLDISEHLTLSHHCPPLWHPTSQQYVEVHERLGDSASHLFLTEEVCSASILRQIDGLRFKVPDTYARLQHNAAHHYLSNIIKKKANPSFRQLLDFARLSKKWAAEEPNAGAVDALCNCPEIKSAIRISAALSEDVFGDVIPHSALKTHERRYVGVFRLRLDSPLLDRLYSSANACELQLRRIRNWRKLLTRRFYQIKVAQISARLR
jgi:hypothetical protein